MINKENVVRNTSPFICSQEHNCFLKFTFTYVYMSVPECMNVYHACIDIPGGQTRALDPLELQAAISHLRWVLGTEPQCSGRAESDLLSLLIGSQHIFNNI